MIIAKGEEPHARQPNEQTGKVRVENNLSCNHMLLHHPSNIYHPNML